MSKHIFRVAIFAAVLASASTAHANCGLSLAVGTMRVANIPTARIDSHLTTRYTAVHTTVRSSSRVNEEGVECELGKGFSLAISGIQGMHVGVDRTVYFTGYKAHGITLPPIDLFDLKEEASGRAIRVSALYTQGREWPVSPFIRLGVEQLKAKHIAKLPLTYTDPDGERVYAFSYEKSYNKTAPYVGAGLTLTPWKNLPIKARIEYQYMAPSPHRADAIFFGIVANFAF